MPFHYSNCLPAGHIFLRPFPRTSKRSARMPQDRAPYHSLLKFPFRFQIDIRQPIRIGKHQAFPSTTLSSTTLMAKVRCCRSSCGATGAFVGKKAGASSC